MGAMELEREGGGKKCGNVVDFLAPGGFIVVMG